MSFEFQHPSIHGVKNITARARTIQNGNGGFACLGLVFHGDEGEPQEMDVYFPPEHIDRAHALAALINAPECCRGLAPPAECHCDKPSQIAAAPDMKAAVAFAKPAKAALDGYERDLGEELPDDHEIGRIEESRDTPSFRIRVGHIRMMAAAFDKSEPALS